MNSTEEIPTTEPVVEPKTEPVTPATDPVESSVVAEEEEKEDAIKPSEDEIIKALTESLTPEEQEIALKDYSRLGEESGVPTIENTKHYLHLVKYLVSDNKGKQWAEYKNVISPFDKHITARWIRLRTIVTRFGYDQQNCDYWDLLYICNRFHHLAGKEIGVFLLIHSSAMAELSLFSPKVMMNIDSGEVANLLNGSIMKSYIDMTSDNISKKKEIMWLDKHYRRIINMMDTTGDKQFALMADLARRLPSSDRWNPPDKMTLLGRLVAFFRRPEILKPLIVIIFLGLIIGMLFASGILRAG